MIAGEQVGEMWYRICSVLFTAWVEWERIDFNNLVDEELRGYEVDF